MKYFSITQCLPTREQPRILEIMHYVTRVVPTLLDEDEQNLESNLLADVRKCFGADLNIKYLDQDGEECVHQLNDHVVIHLVVPHTVH